MYGFEREKNSKRVLGIMNLGTTTQNFTCQDKPSANEWNNVFAANKEPVDKGFGIEPRGYAVYELPK